MCNPDHSATTPIVDVNTLRTQMIAYVMERTEAFIHRFIPDLRWPRYFAGYTVATNDVWTLAHLAGSLHSLGVREIAGHPTTELISTALRQIDGKAPEPFASFKIAETLLRFGPFAGNPILRDFTDAQRASIVDVVNSTHIYDAKTDRISYVNNYWAVLARAELARKKLGLLTDETILNRALDAVRQVMARNPLGFFDDSPSFIGRYDCYSADVCLFTEPFWSMLEPQVLNPSLRAHTRLLESIAMENGAFYVWGRSIGVLSINLTMEMAATALKLNLAENPARMLGLIANAFQQFPNWIADDLMIAHRHRMMFKYRDVFRLLQMTLDCLDKLCYTASLLGSMQNPPKPAAPPVLFPPRDQWVAMDERNAGVWMYRSASLAFQFAVVGVYPTAPDADYVPWFRSPGVLENPVDSPMLCGVPRIYHEHADYVCGGLPTTLDKQPAQLRLVYEGFHAAKPGDTSTLPGRREVTYSVNGSRITASEHWTFDVVPTAISLDIAETARPLTLHVDCPTPHHVCTAAVRGMQMWRSFWGELRNLHQIRFEPAREIAFTYTLDV